MDKLVALTNRTALLRDAWMVSETEDRCWRRSSLLVFCHDRHLNWSQVLEPLHEGFIWVVTLGAELGKPTLNTIIHKFWMCPTFDDVKGKKRPRMCEMWASDSENIRCTECIVPDYYLWSTNCNCLITPFFFVIPQRLNSVNGGCVDLAVFQTPCVLIL